jgi:hypothetical protein
MSYDRFPSQNRKRAMQNRSLAGKAYFANGGQPSDGGSQPSELRPLTSALQQDSPTNSPQKPEADNGSAVASIIPKAAASSAEGQLPLDGNAAKPTFPKLGLRYTR